jgi:hypothetical protein
MKSTNGRRKRFGQNILRYPRAIRVRYRSLFRERAVPGIYQDEDFNIW